MTRGTSVCKWRLPLNGGVFILFVVVLSLGPQFLTACGIELPERNEVFTSNLSSNNNKIKNLHRPLFKL
jgi:hypothetical protein